MGYTLIDYFNAFQNLKRKKRFTAGVQSAYFSILAEFNLQRFPEELELSTRELQALAGLKSVSTAHEAKNVLKNNKLVDFETKRGTTIYRLLSEHLPNETRTAHERRVANQPNAGRTPHALVYDTPEPVDVQTKTCRQEEELSVSYLSTRGRDSLRREGLKENEGATKAANPAAQTAAGRQTCGKDAENGGAYAPLHERTLPLNSLGNLDNLLEYWERDLRGGRLSIEHQSQIAAWLETYGYEWLEAAMREASDANGNTHGLNFKLLRGVVERKLKEPKKPKLRLLKGGEKSGTIDYGAEPDYSWLKDNA